MKIPTQLILLCSGMVLLTAGSLSGAGEYQKAGDGKTMIWNWTPKAGEPTSWSGTRDKENYANGFGDLTWNSPDGKVFGLFYGNMVHGKFEGAVSLHTGKRISHAYFANGERVTEWARGAAKTKSVEQSDPATTAGPTKEKNKIANTQPAVPAPTAGLPESQREVKESPADVSVDALAGPPSSLRANSIRESSLRKPESETKSTPRRDSPLTESEAISMAEKEARLQGFEIENYERPIVDHSNVRRQWTVFYGGKKSEGGSDSPASFSVTVEDKTGQAEIRK